MNYSVHGIGVDGQYGPQRSLMDMQMQKEFGNPNLSSRKGYIGSPVGVMGEDGPQRSAMDMRMQAEFGGLNQEGFQYRTKKDRMMQHEFNPWYKQNREDFHMMEDPYNPYSKYATYIPL
uniref:Uncharacterized protein n=1 Tax=viral metagenome TaxID=1070528 RepID=A0A6C0ELR4_9ZZZZ